MAPSRDSQQGLHTTTYTVFAVELAYGCPQKTCQRHYLRKTLNTVSCNFKFLAFVGFLEEIFVENYLRTPRLPSSSTIINGLIPWYVLLWVCQQWCSTTALLPYPLTFTTTLASKLFAVTGWIRSVSTGTHIACKVAVKEKKKQSTTSTETNEVSAANGTV